MAAARRWIYKHGVLCYFLGDELRILDIHNSADQETVVDIRMLHDDATNETRNYAEYKFRPLYYANNIMSCLYASRNPDQPSWLVVFNDLEHRILIAHPLESTKYIFVRNNEEYIYYGTYSNEGEEDRRRWVIRGFDISKKAWLEDNVVVPSIMGTELGVTTCFEIIGKYFYGISSRTNFEDIGNERISFYNCFRFPIEQPSQDATEQPSRRQRWRRQNNEGPIDNRWTFMRLFTDEVSGDLKILEARKENLRSRSSSTRVYYTKKLVFGNDGDGYDEDDEQCRSTGSLYPPSEAHEESDRWIAREDPDHMPAPKRSPADVHVGDDGLITPLSEYPVRSYYPFAQTFIDVVKEPSERHGWQIRVRAGSRHLRTEEERRERLRVATEPYGDSYTLKQEIEDLYRHKVVYWPAVEQSQELDNISNPLACGTDAHRQWGAKTLNIRGEWDERSLVYAVGAGSLNGKKALVLISFDPGIHLKGVGPFANRSPRPSGHRDPDGPARSADPVPEKERTPLSAQAQCAWAKREPAQYQTIAKGYHFAE